jgi:hypothetical protein
MAETDSSNRPQLFAALAGRMFYSPSYKYNLLGVVFFKIRDFLDSVDGEVKQGGQFFQHGYRGE